MCLFPRQNFALFLRKLGPKLDHIQTRGLEILNQVAITKKGLGSPNLVNPRNTGCAATRDIILYATCINNTLPLLQSFNLKISSV
jgi:hypothetical protein